MPAQMLHSPADVVRWLLIENGIGSNPDNSGTPWPVYQTTEPDTPNNIITMYDQKGLASSRDEFGNLIGSPGILFRIRSAMNEFRGGWEKASEILDVVMRTSFVTISVNHGGASAIYQVNQIQPVGHIITLGKNAPSILGATAPTSKRNVFVLNAVVSLQMVP